MLCQFDYGEIAAPNSPFDVVETYSDGIGFVAGRAASAPGAAAATSSANSFLHLHHFTSFIDGELM